jgi:hypothetical protein
MLDGLLAMADRIPNQEALDLAPTIGWLMLGCATCTALIFICYREGWRRLWLRMEDPRSLGAFRIAFGLCALANVNGLWELFGYLFTDEGLFVTDVARRVFAYEQFQGFGDGLGNDPYGFFGWDGFWQWLKGPKYSLLLFNSTPTFFWAHQIAFEIAMAMLIVGYQTRWVKWVAWFLFHSIILRNSIYWEGTENVYRTFFFYLCLSRCGQAYSVDNWLRCRKLRAQGRLSTRDGPGGGAGLAPDAEHPEGLQPVYRLVPGWPRLLVILQSAAIYCYTGVVKNGGIWWKGDAFYYAFNLDHFYRVPPQTLSAYLGTNLFRLNSHVAHFWESFFPVLVFGLIARWVLRADLPPLSRGVRRIANLSWLGLGFFALAVVWVAYPVHFLAPKDSWWTLTRVRYVFAGGWIGMMLVVAWGWHRLRYRPFELKLRGKVLRLDLDTFLKWTLGRRVWLAVGTIFHLHLIIMMNIGWFSAGCLTGFICFLNGGEIARLLQSLGRALAWLRVPGIPAHVVRGDPPLPAADPTLPGGHHDGARLPMFAILVALGLALLGVVLQVRETLHFGWTLVGIGAFLFGVTLRERAASRPPLLLVRRPGAEGPDGEPASPEHLSRPWAYGPIGRFAVGALTIYHVVGVACWLLPDKDSFAWRTATHEPFRFWLETTQTTQGWKMFAPNPPRANLYLRVLVTDANDEVFDMNTDMYHPSQRPIPWIFYTRQRKINRRVAGAEGGNGSWYQKWHARYFCKQWALEHGGVHPKKVELVKITYPIPSPEAVAKDGPYDPLEQFAKFKTERTIYTVFCDTEIEAQLLNEIRARHDLPESDVKIRRWSELRGKKERWDNRLEREAKAEAAEAEAAKAED